MSSYLTLASVLEIPSLSPDAECLAMGMSSTFRTVPQNVWKSSSSSWDPNQCCGLIRSVLAEGRNPTINSSPSPMLEMASSINSVHIRKTVEPLSTTSTLEQPLGAAFTLERPLGAVFALEWPLSTTLTLEQTAL